MKHSAPESPKEHFQLERVALFSDAVFAIAITLLILEVRVPEIERGEISDPVLREGLSTIAPKIVSFLISFYVIGTYWLSHHRLFFYVDRCSGALLRNNLLFLLPIVIMPFSTAYISSYYNGTARVPLALYTVNIGLAGFFIYRLWQIIAVQARAGSHRIDASVVRYHKTRALTIPIVFLLVLFVSYISVTAAYIVLPLTVFAGYLVKRYYLRKYTSIRSHLQ